MTTGQFSSIEPLPLPTGEGEKLSVRSGRSRGRRLTAGLLWTSLYGATGLLVALVLFLVIYILMNALPNVTWELLSTSPSYLEERIGLLPDIVNTIYIVVAALAFVLPMGVGTAIYLTEYATNARLARAIEYCVETLAGIPSIIFGLVGMLAFCQFLGFQTSLLAGALTLMIMNLPTVIRTTQESLKGVSPLLREAALGLGAQKWHMVRTVVLPSAVSGIATGAVLSVGRMLGESAALLFTAGFAHTLHGIWTGLQAPGATLTVALYVYAKEQGEFEVAFVIAGVLLVLSFVLNALAAFLAHRMKVTP